MANHTDKEGAADPAHPDNSTNTGNPDDQAARAPADDGGEDDGSAPKEGDDGHLKEDQKPTNS